MITRQFLFVIAAFGLWACASCQHRTSVYDGATADEDAREGSADELEDDSLSAYESEELMDEMDPIPNRKEAFSEFFFTFISNKSFQAARVKFPLPVEEEDDTREIRSGKDFRNFFTWPSTAEYCVVVNQEEQMENFLNDTDISDVDVQLIDLAPVRVRQFHFNRAKNEWFAMSAKAFEPEGTLGDFLRFYGKFAADSVYQQSHLAEQIEFSQSDLEEEGENINGTIEAYQWSTFKPELPNGRITNFLFGQDLENSSDVVLMHSSIADGMVESFRFHKRNGHWLLTGYNN